MKKNECLGFGAKDLLENCNPEVLSFLGGSEYKKVPVTEALVAADGRSLADSGPPDTCGQASPRPGGDTGSFSVDPAGSGTDRVPIAKGGSGAGSASAAARGTASSTASSSSMKTGMSVQSIVKRRPKSKGLQPSTTPVDC